MKGGYAPNILDAKLTLGRCYKQLKNIKKAHFWLFFALHDSPNAEICCEIGDLFAEDNKFKQAEAFYKFALCCPDPKETGEFVNGYYYYTYPYLQLVSLCWRLGKCEESKKYHLLAKQSAPDNDIVMYNDKFFV